MILNKENPKARMRVRACTCVRVTCVHACVCMRPCVRMCVRMRAYAGACVRVPVSAGGGACVRVRIWGQGVRLKEEGGTVLTVCTTP